MKGLWRFVPAMAVVVLAGCGASATSKASSPLAPPSSSASTTSTAPAAASAPPVTAVRAEPTLGVLAGTFSHGSGFGQIEPTAVSNGGDPTGIVNSITWTGWGDAQAIGTGRSDYVAPNQSVAAGTIESARIVAFDLGTCNGRYMYEAVEWYFPEHGQTFDPTHFEDICSGAYYPLQTGSYADGGGGLAHYTLTLSGPPESLTGSISEISATGSVSPSLLSFHGHAGIDGSLAVVSSGPAHVDQTLTGTWQSTGLQLDNCDSYLSSAASSLPSCTFYFEGPG